MDYKRTIIVNIVSFYFILLFKLMAQPYGMGELLDAKKFMNSPKSPTLTRGDFRKLPHKFSLKQYCPVPGDQGNSSTCTGWATSYSARTILEAIQYDWNQEQINEITFSPSYVYNQIRPKDGCQAGASLIDGLELLKNDGVLLFSEFGYDCERKVKNEDKIKAAKYKLKEYREIASRYSKNKILSIKKSISQLKPVVIGFNCPKSLFTATEVWHPHKEDYNKNFNGHAMTIIGYDDGVEGGAFEILNSWGVNWGNNGFIWIRYSDIDHFCVWAGELISDNHKKINKINTALSLQEYPNRPVLLSQNLNSYITVDTFFSGSKFQLHINNNQPAYLYVFGFDKNTGLEYLFPSTDNMSDYLAYTENNIIIPSEDQVLQLDDNSGLSSLIILLSTSRIRKVWKR